jgi:hypothetical protein
MITLNDFIELSENIIRKKILEKKLHFKNFPHQSYKKKKKEMEAERDQSKINKYLKDH